MRYRLPEISDKSILQEYMQEHYDNKESGISVSLGLPEELTKKYGDIGYGVRPSERNKGYATTMLRDALSVCKEKGKDKVLLGCYKDNLASAATIKKNGGVLVDENDNYNEGRISQYYLIEFT